MARSEGTSEGPAYLQRRPPPILRTSSVNGGHVRSRAFKKPASQALMDRLLPEKSISALHSRQQDLYCTAAPKRKKQRQRRRSSPRPRRQAKGKGEKGIRSPLRPLPHRREPSAAPAPAQAPVREDALLPSTTPSNEPWKKVVGKKHERGKKASGSCLHVGRRTSPCCDGLVPNIDPVQPEVKPDLDDSVTQEEVVGQQSRRWGAATSQPITRPRHKTWPWGHGQLCELECHRSWLHRPSWRSDASPVGFSSAVGGALEDEPMR
ncbi:unnamed protein product [Danaus chrysippus]|uniref:(African queen) hypothetical protein n=1 Tax=Danaus chrysippus TaxID=151541 RepID=A0A8J2M7K6_9NEOP|nr:unnamed protein product [Danaus chrysippus]